MSAFYAALITINAICIALVLLSGTRTQIKQNLWLVVSNAILILFHSVTWQLHSAQSLQQALVLSRTHTALVLILLPLVIYTYTNLCQQAYKKTLVLTVSLVGGALLLFHFVAPQPIRFGGDISLAFAQMPFDNVISVLHDDRSAYPWVFWGYSVLTLGALCYLALHNYWQKRNCTSALWCLFSFAQSTALIVGILVDWGLLSWFYIGGLPLSLLSLYLTLSAITIMKQQQQHLQGQVLSDKEQVDAFVRLTRGLSSPGCKLSFEEMLKIIYEFSGTEWVFIGIFDDLAPRVTTKLVLRHGNVIPNFTYELKGSPCEVVKSNRTCIYPNHVAETFPNDRMLAEEHINAYVGLPMRDDHGKPFGLLVLMHDKPFSPSKKLSRTLDMFLVIAAAEIRRDLAEKQLKKLAYIDYMTNLPNRTKLLDELNTTYFERQSEGSNGLLLLLDLDFFGQINRKYGANVCDELMKILADRLSKMSSDNVFVARNNGDEFVVLIKKIQGEAASVINVYWTAIEAVVSQVCEVENLRLHVSCSGGAVFFPQQITDRATLLSSAEHALMEAKRKGRRQYCVFDPSLLKLLEQKHSLQEDLSRALSVDNELELAYQPKVNSDGQVIGAEALLRWSHPTLGNISPAEFIPLAEESGLINELGFWVTKALIHQIRLWHDNGVNIPAIAINLSAMQLNDDSYVNFIEQRLQDQHLSPALIEFELTESSILINEQKAIRNMAKLRKLGITMALDDFGTGYSSLSYLQKLPIDILKIDKSFVDNLNDVKSEELIRAIINIAKVMSFRTVAEGTETEAQITRLKELGCDYFQGYFYSKPLFADAFISYCERTGVVH